MAVALKNRAGVSTSTFGTGPLILGPALPAGTAPYAASWQNFTDAGAAHGDIVRYLILDTLGRWEYGPGQYSVFGPTLSRPAGVMTGTVPGQRSSTGELLALTGTSQVYITAVAEDFADASIVVPTGIKTQRIAASAPELVPLAADDIVICTVGGTVALPPSAARAGKAVTFKDIVGVFNATPLALVPSGAELIDGLPSWTLGNDFMGATMNPFNTGGLNGWFVT